MIRPGTSFKENLGLLPSIEGLARIELLDPQGSTVATIANEPGKQGSLAVYQYLHKAFGLLDAKAAAHGMEVFGEHTADARNRPGGHPNIDRLITIAEGGAPLSLRLIAA